MEDFYGNENTVYDTAMCMTCVIIRFSKPTECVPPRVNPNITMDLVTVMCQRRFINCKKCTTLGWGRGHC